MTRDITDERLYGLFKRANLYLNTRLSSASDPMMVYYFFLNENGYALISDFSAFDIYVSTMIKINPYNKQSFFKGMMKILKKSGYFSQKDLEAEKQKHPKVVETIDGQKWLMSLLTDMKQARSLRADGQEFFEIKKLEQLSKNHYKLDGAKLKVSFKQAKKILIICGLEGTLMSETKGELVVTNDGKTIRLPPKVNRELQRALEGISKDNRVSLYVVTSRSLDDVKEIFGDQTTFGIGAEKGYYFKMAGEANKGNWENICDFNESWKTIAMNIMKQYERKIPGSLTEYSNTGVVWTFDANADEITYKQSQTLKKTLQKTLTNYPSIEVVSGDGFVEVKHHVISKAAFAELLIRYLQQDGVQIDLIVAVGSGQSNEALFSSLSGMVTNPKILAKGTELYCISIGGKNTQAKYYLDNIEELETLIRELKGSVSHLNMPKPGSFAVSSLVGGLQATQNKGFNFTLPFERGSKEAKSSK